MLQSKEGYLVMALRKHGKTKFTVLEFQMEATRVVGDPLQPFAVHRDAGSRDGTPPVIDDTKPAGLSGNDRCGHRATLDISCRDRHQTGPRRRRGEET